MNEISTCPFCKFSKQEWESNHPDTYAADWDAYAPFETTILGHNAIECANCWIVVIDTIGGVLEPDWDKLSEVVNG